MVASTTTSSAPAWATYQRSTRPGADSSTASGSPSGIKISERLKRSRLFSIIDSSFCGASPVECRQQLGIEYTRTIRARVDQKAPGATGSWISSLLQFSAAVPPVAARGMETMEEVVIVGGGLVGSLLSLFLAARGYAVRVFERNPDPRTAGPSSGRSINLTLSHRGFAALSRAGVIDAVRAIAMPAYGRVIHGEDGGLAYQPYGIHREALFSITRSDLNRVLLDIAAPTPGIEIRFRQKCVGLDGSAPAVILEDLDSGQTSRERAGMIFGADGAFSAVRLQLQKTDRFDYSQEYIDQGYKELSVPPPAVQAWGLDPEALHIWPRGRYMLIGFANFDGSFTLALHLPYEGAPSFAAVRDESDLLRFFAHSFPDALPHIPNLVGDFFGRPVSSMLTVRCFPW